MNDARSAFERFLINRTKERLLSYEDEKLCRIATILDPRFKNLVFKFTDDTKVTRYLLILLNLIRKKTKSKFNRFWSSCDWRRYHWWSTTWWAVQYCQRHNKGETTAQFINIRQLHCWLILWKSIWYHVAHQ